VIESAGTRTAAVFVACDDFCRRLAEIWQGRDDAVSALCHQNGQYGTRQSVGKWSEVQMAVFNGAFPILPGKLDEARAFAQATMGQHRADFDDAQRRAGITRETWTIERAPDGSAFMLVWFEAGDPAVAFAQLMEDSEHNVWFRGRVKEVTGVDLSGPPSEGGPEVVLDWSA
jgi:hypothetical protein